MTILKKTTDKNIFTIEVSRDNGNVKISAHENVTGGEKTIRHYETLAIDDNKINEHCSRIVDLLNRANKSGKVDKSTSKELQSVGSLIYDSLLTPAIKSKLAAAHTENLIVNIDDRLVHIPWELLYDGKQFLCRKFNMGRVVRTSQAVTPHVMREVKEPLKMLVIADPRGDLDSSYNEGVSLRDELDKAINKVEVDVKFRSVTADATKEIIRDFDIVHYAGHADYDIHNPSQSAFLMEESRLKASDITGMAGMVPLPSLVFSNACKTGHTEMWRVEEDYETEIYGLANAFLLAGVRHYIGTFWDVQDEPSLFFALYFYRALTEGAAVGEAVKQARIGLIEKYGEETIIWASYMLYGDPTVRYMDSGVKKRKSKREEESETRNAAAEDELLTAGTVRGTDAVLALPQKRNQWLIIGAVILVAFISYFSLSSLKKGKEPSDQDHPVVTTESKDKKRERIDRLVSGLIKNYRQNQKSVTGTSTINKTIAKPVLVFLNIKATGISEFDKDFIFSKITNSLQTSGRVDVVERELLDKLLEELNLSSTRLADPSRALEVGKILSAQLISTGSISREGKDWQASLRLIETETTSIKAAVTESLETGDKEDVAERLSQEILKVIRASYPLKGRLLFFENDEAVLDTGHERGAVKGLKLNVFSDTEGVKTAIGVVEITSADENSSVARILNKHDDFKKGLEVEEVL